MVSVCGCAGCVLGGFGLCLCALLARTAAAEYLYRDEGCRFGDAVCDATGDRGAVCAVGAACGGGCTRARTYKKRGRKGKEAGLEGRGKKKEGENKKKRVGGEKREGRGKKSPREEEEEEESEREMEEEERRK